MLYIKDNIIKDSSLITIETSNSVIYNPDHKTLQSYGWRIYDESLEGTKILNNRGFITTTNSEFELAEKSEYNDSIVFIQDETNPNNTGKIWSNGKFYGGGGDVNIIEIYDNSNNYNITLDPNTYYKLDNQIDEITITLNQLSDTSLNKYYLEFFGNSPTVVFNDNIVFDKDIIPNFNYSLSENGMCKYLLEFNNTMCNIKYLKYVNEWYELTYNVTNYDSPVQLISSNVDSNITFKINE